MKVLIAVRLAWAALLMCCPKALLRVAGEAGPDRRLLVVARVLGIRHLAEAWMEHGRGKRRIEAARLVDGLHAASAFAFGLASKRHRRVAFVDAGVATGFALSSIWYEARTADRASRCW